MEQTKETEEKLLEAAAKAAFEFEIGYERELKELKISRENDIEYRKVLKGLQERFAEKHKDMLTSMKENQEAMSKLEGSIKTKALAEYAADKSKPKNKTLALGVKIQEREKLVFDEKLAKDWAREHNLAWKLDLPAFKKIAKAQKIDFVTIEDYTIATIPPEIETE